MENGKPVRISPETHADLKKYAKKHGMTMGAAVAMAVQALSPTIVVAVNKDGEHRIVESYACGDDIPNERVAELIASGFSGYDVSRSDRVVLGALFELRPYGPEWKRATGWTP